VPEHVGGKHRAPLAPLSPGPFARLRRSAGTTSLSVMEDPRLQDVVRRLVEAYHPDRIYLFGSRARGDAEAGSDYDLLLVVPDDASAERGRGRLAHECLWEAGVAADVLVLRRTAFKSGLHLPASLPATVLREGRILHAT
jgi:hypothetical protein